MKQGFSMHYRLPGLNEVIAANRRNRFAGAKLKRETDAAIQWAIREARLQPVEGPCEVRITFTEPNRRRDVDNVESAKKFILDALVKAGILRGDSPRWVTAVPSCTKYGDGPLVEVEMVEGGGKDAGRRR